jgi:hypothetical protein
MRYEYCDMPGLKMRLHRFDLWTPGGEGGASGDKIKAYSGGDMPTARVKWKPDTDNFKIEPRGWC